MLNIKTTTPPSIRREGVSNNYRKLCVFTRVCVCGVPFLCGEPFYHAENTHRYLKRTCTYALCALTPFPQHTVRSERHQCVRCGSVKSGHAHFPLRPNAPKLCGTNFCAKRSVCGVWNGCRNENHKHMGTTHTIKSSPPVSSSSYLCASIRCCVEELYDVYLSAVGTQRLN